MLFSSPRSTAGAGVRYSTGYSFRSASMAFLTRSSSSIRNVLIQVIGPRSLRCNPCRESVSAAGPRTILRGDALHYFPGSCFLLWSRADGYAVMLVNGLAFVVISGMRLAVRARDRLRGFIGLETKVTSLVLLCLRVVAESVVAKHEVVVGLQVFRIDRQRFLKLRDGVGVALLEEKNAAEFVVHHAVARELLEDGFQVGDGAVVVAVFAKRFCVKEVCAG